MCGICGTVSRNPNTSVDMGLLRRMTEAIIHRGPDDDGYYLSGPIGLGMRRLSIIDLEGGKQPVHNEDSSITVVFNGEIYNYPELQSTLEASGHVFYTRSDTETIVHAYEEYGEAFLEKLRGMFGLALWDTRTQSLLLAVDRFGIKPLYYSAQGEELLFGSEMKCLLACASVKREIDLDALAQYFTLGYIPAPASVFQSVRKLPAGNLLLWTPSSGTTVRQYWDMPSNHLEQHTPRVETCRRLREVLKDAVQSHLISDVPLGAFLSGGVDSSTVVALMSEVSTTPVRTFSIGFADQEYNELGYARLVAQRFGTDHHELIVEPETVDVLPDIVSHFGEPFADASALPTYFVSKMARQFVKVALSGDGGDELFLGYTVFRGVEMARYIHRLPGPVRTAIAVGSSLLPVVGRPAWDDRAARWGRRLASTVLPPREAYHCKISLPGLESALPLLSPEFRQQLSGRNPWSSVDGCLDQSERSDHGHPLEPFVYAGLKVPLADDMLVKVDRMSMANSLEVRVPLLDHLLAEYVLTVPIEQRFPRWRLKALLKDTMADALPPEVLSHRKQGFSVPLSTWFRGSLAGFAADVLLSREARQRGFLDTSAFSAMLERHRGSNLGVGPLVWSLLVFELWCRDALDG